MLAVFQCPRCKTPLGTSDDPRPDPLLSCPGCGWAPAVSGRRGWLSIVLWVPVSLIGGLVAGAVIGHAMYLVPLAIAALGVGAAVKIARGFADGWWLMLSAYCAGLFFGALFFADGQTVTNMTAALWIAGISGFCGLVGGLFKSRD